MSPELYSPRVTIARALRFLGNVIRPNIEVYKAPDNILVDWDLPIALRDGTVLGVNVFRPKRAEPVPVIMSAHPYGKDKIPAKTRSGRGPAFQARVLPQPHKIRISEYTSWEAPDPVVWVEQGYAVINADLRGGGTSEGVGDLFSDEEAQDFYELIEWAGTQSWSSGKVGLDGVSYLAISQYKVAALRPPHLAAICPWEGLTDLYRDFARPGGVREEGFSSLWSRLTESEARVRSSFRDGIIAHPERDDWYLSKTPDMARIDVPLLVCGSFSDQCLHTYGSFELFRRAGSARKWLYTHRDGKWCAYYGEDATRTRIRFFDHVLKGLDNGWASEPPVRLAITEQGPDPADIVGEHAWPPDDLTWRVLWLDARTGTLAEGATPPSSATLNIQSPQGIAIFIWVVPEDIDIIGPMALHLHLKVDGADDAFIFAGIRKVSAGTEVLFEGSYGFSGDMVSKGWQRAAHRALDTDLSTAAQPVHRHERAEPLKEGEIVPIAIALRPHATRFRRGEQLRLEIRGQWHYPGDILRGQFPARYEKSPKGRWEFHTGGKFDANLLIGTRTISGLK